MVVIFFFYFLFFFSFFLFFFFQGEYFQCPAYYLFKNFESDCYFCWFSSPKFIGDDEFPQTGDLVCCVIFF